MPVTHALDRVPAPALVLAAIASVQVGAAIARSLFDELGASGVLVLRLGLASVFLLLVLRPKVRHWSRRSWQAAIGLGVTMAGMNWVFYQALRTVPLGIAVTVEFIGPLLLALVQTRRLTDLLWALMAVGGVALLGLDTTSGIPVSGLLLALLAGLLWAAYILSSARLGRLLPGIDGLAVALTVATLVVLPLGAGDASAVLEHPSLLVGGAAVALLSSVLCYGFELTALRRIPTRVFGILMSIEPAAAALAGLLLLHQALARHQVVALVLVSLASVGVTLGRREGEPPPQPLE
jgi:inner membrane transporter RhtA